VALASLGQLEEMGGSEALKDEWATRVTGRRLIGRRNSRPGDTRTAGLYGCAKRAVSDFPSLLCISGVHMGRMRFCMDRQMAFDIAEAKTAGTMNS
jgi:hypothetical protein